MKGLLFLFIFISFLLCSCSNSAQIHTSEKSMLSKIIKEKFPQQNSIQYNTNKTYALCLNNTKSQSNKPLKFFVYSIKTDKIILEDSLPKGKVKWLNENQIEVTSVPGIVRGREGKENQENGYIFDLKLQKKINKFQIDRQK